MPNHVTTICTVKGPEKELENFIRNSFKDILDEPILQFLAQHQGKWCTYGVGYSMPTVQDAMPHGVSKEIQLEKMKNLVDRDLVEGCTCGCRGDFEITDEGLEFIGASRVKAAIAILETIRNIPSEQNQICDIVNCNYIALYKKWLHLDPEPAPMTKKLFCEEHYKKIYRDMIQFGRAQVSLRKKSPWIHFQTSTTGEK